MQFKIVGANAESGDDVDVMLEATSEEDVQRIAHDKGILVAAIVPVVSATKHDDFSAISLVDDAPAVGGAGANGAAAERPHGMITTNATNPADTAHTGEGHIAAEKHNESVATYHIIMNQSLYLLETAVNKHLKDGWDVQGGMSVSVNNNACQFFQAVIKRPKVA